MKFDISITPDGDFNIEDGDVAYVDEIDRIKQGIFTRLSIAKEEWFMDIDFGYDRDSIEGARDLAIAQEVIVEAVLQDPDIDSCMIDKIELNKKTRKLDAWITCEVFDVEVIEMEVSF